MKQKLFNDQYIVITGAGGFIGSCIVRYLNDKGFTNLILVDDFKKTIKWKNLVGKKFIDIIPRFELMNWLKNKSKDVEAIIHLGACSSTVEDDWDYLMKVNYRFSVDLASYAIEHDIRFIYASSAATYGMGEIGYSDAHDIIDQLHPLNPYGYSKQLFDQWLYRQNLLSFVVGLKFFNVFGPNEYHKGRMASMVLHMANAIQKEGKVKLFQSSEPQLFGDGEQCRDFVYVKDVAAMTCFFLENNDCGIFNIGSGTTHTWNELATAVFHALGKKVDMEYIPMPVDLIGKYQNYTCADMKKFQEVYKKEENQLYKFYQFEDTVKEYVQDYLVKDARW
ncbi:MAG: ADP-glyceromanno-heptose 6-epimerase [Chlamydiales bacterium]|nr:ADP-glyceromanno-heptose 6-epimerase [Chlamydiales bacterium]